MRRVDYWPYQTNRSRYCNVCNRPLKEKIIALFYKDNTIYGDLVICPECRQMLDEIINGEEQVITEWDFSEGGINNGELDKPD